MPYTLFGNWEELPKEEPKTEPKKKTPMTDLFKIYYASSEKAKEDAKKVNETHCWLTPTKGERKLFRLWEKEERKAK